MARRFLATTFLVTALIAVAAAVPMATCSGSARYDVTFKNFLTPENFGDLIPATGVFFSPLASFSHSNRFSFFTVRGFANRAVEEISETGVSRRILRVGRRARDQGRGVKSVVDAGVLTSPGTSTTVTLDIDCENSFVTVIAMLSPSPDWVVQINNMNLFDSRRGRFIRRRSGDLIAYDAGVDDSRDFTNPGDLSLDIPTVPQKNIAPLVEDETDRFEGRVVGQYLIRRID